MKVQVSIILSRKQTTNRSHGAVEQGSKIRNMSPHEKCPDTDFFQVRIFPYLD